MKSTVPVPVFNDSVWSVGQSRLTLTGLVRGRGGLPVPASLLVSLVLGVIAVLLGPIAGARASSSCPNELFRTGPGANLPDCRAYEMVSPPEKNGGEVDEGPILEGEPPNPEQAALNGEAVTYGSTTTFTEANPLSGPLTSQYVSRRGPNGWYTQAITPKQDLPGGVFNREQGAVDFSLFQGFTPDLAHAFMLAYEPALVPGAPEKYYSPYVRDNLAGTYRLLSRETPPTTIAGISDSNYGFRMEYAGMSADGSRVVFSANDKLTPKAGVGGLYESNNGQLELVSELPGGEVTGGWFGRDEVDQGGLNEGYNNVISSDGSRVFWTVGGPKEAELKRIYMRELTAGGARTVYVSASQKNNGTGPGGTDPRGPLPAIYQTASADGSQVFFLSSEKLTNDSTAKREEGSDLYRYETGTGMLTDLSVDPVPGQTANVASVIGVSEDGSSVYFLAYGALVKGALNGLENIYLWHKDRISLVATPPEGRDYGFGGAGTFGNTMRVSPSGRYLAFESVRQLTGYNTTPVQAGACFRVPSWAGEGPILVEGDVSTNFTGRCVEVYEYDAVTGRLTCASCNPRGLPPVGNSIVPHPVHGVSNIAGWQTETDQQRYLLDDGRLFFDSSDALLPQASNAGEMNVYEYEPGGVGSCQREGGCIALISSGTSNEHSLFMDASASGSDVFFTTRQRLVAQDGDEAIDVYDARVNGGFSPAVPPPCGGEACRPPVTPAPAIYGAPPSATFVGPGNPPRPVVGKAKKKPKPKRSRRRHKVKRKTGKSRGGHR